MERAYESIFFDEIKIETSPEVIEENLNEKRPNTPADDERNGPSDCHSIPKRMKFTTSNDAEITIISKPFQSIPDVATKSDITKLLTEMTSLKTHIQQVTENIRTLTNSLQNKQSISATCITPSLEMRNMWSMKTISDVLKTENFLESQTAMVTELKNVGGTHCYNLVQRNLVRLLPHNVAMEFNWLGRHDKHAFSKLRLSQALIEAAAQAGFTKIDSENAIKKWPFRAKERYEAKIKTQSLKELKAAGP